MRTPKIKSAPQPIEMVDLRSQYKGIRSDIDRAIQDVLSHGQFILGPEVKKLEDELARYSNVKYCVSCSNGTDALGLVLMALNIGPGDAVIVPSFTFAATAEAVAWVGAEVIFADVDPKTFNISPESVLQCLDVAKKKDLKAVGIIPVDLFGLPADYDTLEKIAEQNNLWILSDAAQSYGTDYKNRQIGSIGLATSTSFFPSKPLGCYGDGGAVFTNDKAIYETLLSLRVHGKGTDKYDNIRIGMNGRLDTIQAAILLKKFSILDQEIKRRREIAQYYNEHLNKYVQVQHTNGQNSAWAQYTIVLPSSETRKKISESLKAAGIPTAIYYPKPLHLQHAYEKFSRADADLPISESLSQKVLSLPMHPYLDQEMLNHIISHLIKEIGYAKKTS